MPGPAGADLLELTVPVDAEAAEAVCELFERYGGGAVLEVLLREGPADGADLPEPRSCVRTYIGVDDLEARRRLEVGLWHLSQIYPVPEATVRRLTEADWAEAWKAHFAPLRVGPFRIVPSWQDWTPQAGEIVLFLDPGMAFGTGLHPSTQLCLVALAEHIKEGASVLDVGTGSGILAIAAARRGASRLLGLDTDPVAVEIAAQNASRNGVALDLTAGRLADLAPETFDVVAANLLAGTLCELAPELYQRVGAGGILIAAGVLDGQADAVDTRLRAVGFLPAALRASGDWVALVSQRPVDP